MLAKLHYALGNYTDSLKYYEKAQVAHSLLTTRKLSYVFKRIVKA